MNYTMDIFEEGLNVKEEVVRIRLNVKNRRHMNTAADITSSTTTASIVAASTTATVAVTWAVYRCKTIALELANESRCCYCCSTAILKKDVCYSQ